jgi:hypothetical protein
LAVNVARRNDSHVEARRAVAPLKIGAFRRLTPALFPIMMAAEAHAAQRNNANWNR